MSKILVVDPSEALRNTFLHIVKKKKHEVIFADSIDEAKDQLDMYFPDVIFLDIQPEGIDGRPFCRLIKNQREHKSIKIVLVADPAAALIICKEYNADSIIEKPFDITTITQKINDLAKTMELIK